MVFALIQSWQKVLAVTNFVLQTVASAFLDNSLSFYDILKDYYKHFIHLKGKCIHFMQSQYLQCWPFFFISSAICSGYQLLGQIPTDSKSCLVRARSWSQFVDLCLPTCFLGLTTASQWDKELGSFMTTYPKCQCYDLWPILFMPWSCDMVSHQVGKYRDNHKLLLDHLKKLLLEDVLY